VAGILPVLDQNLVRTSQEKIMSVDTSRFMRMLTAGVLLGCSACWADGPCDSSPNPCFSNVTDYLGAPQTILPDSDLLYFKRFPVTESPEVSVRLLSKNLSFPVPDAKAKTYPNTGCSITRGPVGARLFDTVNDWVVSLRGLPVDTNYCGSGGTGANIGLSWDDPLTVDDGPLLPLNFIGLENVQIEVADVNRDGFDDLIISDQFKLILVTAVDPQNPGKGLRIAAEIPLPFAAAIGKESHRHGMVGFGDFNGDGAIDVVVPVLQTATPHYADWRMYVFSVCPTAGFVLFENSSEQESKYTCKSAFDTHITGLVSPPGLLGSKNFLITGKEFNAAIPPRLVGGNFLGRAADQRSQLFVETIESHLDKGYDYYGRLIPTIVGYRKTYRLFTFDANLQPKMTFESPLDYTAIGFPAPEGGFEFRSYNDIVRKGNLAQGLARFGNDRDWVVIAGPHYDKDDLIDGYGATLLAFIDRSRLGAFTALAVPNVAGLTDTPVYGMVVDRFDAKDTNGNIIPRQQIAILYRQKQVRGWSLGVWSLTSDVLFPVGSVAPTVTDINPKTMNYPGFDWEHGGLFSGDTQGRSLLLGPGTKAVMDSHFQTDVALGIPPMHIDYVRDASNKGPQVLNLTVLPSGPSKAFNTQYAFSSTGNNKAEYSQTIDTSTSIQTTFENKTVLGDEKATNFTTGFKSSAKEAVETNSNTKNTQYESTTRTLDATTGFADHLFISGFRENFWYYPVLGKRCLLTNPNCPADEKQRQTVIVSAPDKPETLDIDATNVEWYQPVNEPGNIFSYPWNLDQMNLANPLLNPLTRESWSLTDTSTVSAKTEWKKGGDRALTTGVTGKWDLSLGASFSVQVGIEKSFTTQNRFSIDLSHSGGVKTVNTTTTVLDASTGLIVNKPGFSSEVANKYYYYFASYILGQNPAGSSLIQPHLTQSNGQPVDQEFFGPLTVAFAADPFHSTNSSAWWRQAYSKPDIGLNHPARWSWDPNTKAATFNPPEAPGDDNPIAVLVNPFYYMKGFYTFEASDDPKAPIEIGEANPGDLLTLQVRIYNFSLADMPAGSTARARFYGQIYDSVSGTLSGDAFLIGDAKVAAIPGFKSDRNGGTQPNWKLASTTFDTTNYAGKLLVFWVVAWGEDAAGNLIEEQEGHGLKENPANLTFKQITDVPIENYSNNIGIHNSHTPFFVRPTTSAAATAALVAAAATSTSSAEGDPDQLGTNDIVVNTTPVSSPTQRSEITVSIHNRSDGALFDQPVEIYDGDPEKGGELIDYQEVPYVDKDDTYTLRSSIVPDRPGEREIFVRMGREGDHTPGYGTATLNVP
jgi:hypothetical protein